MKILHIGWGFRPWRGGGLIQYAEDLMSIQKLNGYDVYYFFSGRHYPILKKTRLIRWNKSGIKMYEIINSPIFHAGDKGTLFPELDLNEPKTEDCFRHALRIIDPDLIHIHELAGLPSSLVEIAKEEFNKQIIMTLADYFLLCPTLKLFKHLSDNCLEKEIGGICVDCCFEAPQDKSILVHHTINYELKRLNIYNPVRAIYNFFLSRKNRHPLIHNLNQDDSKYDKNKKNYRLAENFEKRRLVNIERLNKIDLLIARSHKVEKIYSYFLGDNKKITTLQPTVKHLELIKSKKIKSIDYPIKFVTLNGCASIPKGAHVMLKSLKLLEEKELGKLCQFHIYGAIHEEIKSEILSFNNVYYHGFYTIDKINDILEGMHFGIVPSVWEEVFGYVGLELLAKGIPIVGTDKGGITEYTMDGKTGFVNKSATAEEMADIIERIITNPKTIIELNQTIIENKDKIIKTMDAHLSEIMNLCKQYLHI